MNNTLEINSTPLPPLYIGTIKPKRKKIYKTHGVGIVTHVEKPTDHSADPFVDIKDINKVVEYGLEHRAFGKVALFVFGINTGYRCGDILGFRVCDFYDENGKFVDLHYICEDKTMKARPVYVNKAARMAVELAIREKHLSPNDYVFCSDGNKRAYLKKFVYDDNGKIAEVLTSPEKYDENGNTRTVAPFDIGTIIRWLKNTTKELGIYGHYSSHAMRQTFSEHIGRNFEDNRNVLVSSVALAHSSVKTTIEHYLKVDPNRLRKAWLGMNLGLEALEKFALPT